MNFRQAFPAKPCTSGAKGHHPGVSLIDLYAVMGLVTRIRRRLRHLPQLRQLLRNSGELFRRRRSSLVEGEHIIAFVSSFRFRFAIPVHVWRSSPSNLYLSSSLCSVAVKRGAVQLCCCHPSAVAAPDSGHLRYSLPQVRISTNSPSSSPSVLRLV
jgi:hypothetical protein